MIEFSVIGTPAPQGSKRKGNVGQMFEASKLLAPWRDSVAWAAREAMQKQGRMEGPVVVSLVFTLLKPKSAPKKRLYPDRKPDLDKLIRSTMDALTTSGIIEDDARVVGIIAEKHFPASGEGAGCFIRLGAPMQSLLKGTA